MRPEQPARILRSTVHLKPAHPGWSWRAPATAPAAPVLAGGHSADLPQLIDAFLSAWENQT